VTALKVLACQYVPPVIWRETVRDRRLTFGFFSLAVAVAFFASSLILLNIGRNLGVRYLGKEGTGSMSGLSTVEGAIFGLMGLLLAFTFSGALQRFDERRQLILQEANAVSTAYDRLALLGPDAGRLQAAFKDYTKARIDLYTMPEGFSLSQRAEVWPPQQLAKIDQAKTRLWDAAVAECPPSGYRVTCSLVLPTLSNAFEVARLRSAAVERHPPQIVYIMLFCLGLGGSLLAGFGMAAAAARSWVHMVIFSGALAVTLYVVADLEFPRLGLIRLERFDHFLVNAYEAMK